MPGLHPASLPHPNHEPIGDPPFVAFHEDCAGSVYAADALAMMGTLEASSIDLLFLDPPFNLGKLYSTPDVTDSLPESVYSAWLSALLEAATRLLAPGGSLFVYHLPKWALRIAAKLDDDLLFRHWIAISMKNGFARGRRLYPAHYALLYFTNGEPSSFYRPRLEPETCRNCGETLRDYGGYRSIIAKQGVNLSDVWTDISPVRHRSQKTRTANELPTKLTDRVVAIAGRPGGLFLDPFCGSGAAVASAVNSGMKFVASDISEESCRVTANRLRTALLRSAP